MKLITTVLLISGIALFGGISCSHRSVPCSPAAMPPGIPENQHVSIAFERFDNEKGVIWLRLINRTAWAIRVPVELSPHPGEEVSMEILRSAKSHQDGAEAPVRYYLEEYDQAPAIQAATGIPEYPAGEPERPPVPRIHRSDFMTEWWIQKNESIIFQAPKEHVARNTALYVDLRYEWENVGLEVLDGPVHRAYFRGMDLPKDIQAYVK
jgi:hypothetical protein